MLERSSATQDIVDWLGGTKHRKMIEQEGLLCAAIDVIPPGIGGSPRCTSDVVIILRAAYEHQSFGGRELLHPDARLRLGGKIIEVIPLSPIVDLDGE